MDISSYTTIIITPQEGMYLTQVDDVDIEERVIATTVAIGANDSASNWKEITSTEAESINKLKEEARKQQRSIVHSNDD